MAPCEPPCQGEREIALCPPPLAGRRQAEPSTSRTALLVDIEGRNNARPMRACRVRTCAGRRVSRWGGRALCGARTGGGFPPPQAKRG